jgi:SAM-dependent methyltransferase
MIEVSSCPACRSASRTPLFVARDTEYEIPGAFPVSRCSECGLVYLSRAPSPAELSRFYPENYGAYQDSNGWAKRVVWKMLAFFVLRSPAAYYNIPIDAPPNPGARVLEIGMGSGIAGEILAAKGWTVIGCDFSRAATARGASRGLQCVRGNADHLPFKNGSFEAVFASHVIEHTYDPAAVLTRIREILAPGGRLLLSVPNFDSLDRVIIGPEWFAGLSAPRHLVHFTPTTLTQMLANSGLEVAVVRSTPQPTFVESLLKRLGVSFPTIRQSPLLKVLIALGAPIDFLFYLVGRGTNILAIGVAPMHSRSVGSGAP